MHAHDLFLATTLASGKSSPIASLLPFLVLIGLVLFMVRSQRRRAAATRKLTDDLHVGIEVLTRAGQIGRITELSDTEVSLEIAPGVVSRYVRGAILAPFVPPSADVADAAARRQDDVAPENGG